MAWFNKPRYSTTTGKSSAAPNPQKGLWTKCPDCNEVIYNKEWEQNKQVCPKCQSHQKLSAAERIALLVDEGSFQQYDAQLTSMDPLQFQDAKGSYAAKLSDTQKRTGMADGIITGSGKINGIPAELGVMEFGFLGGSMGTVIGEKICRTIDRAIKHRHPVVIVSCSGGARMHEGILSLMQMAKTSAWLAKLSDHKLPFISILTHPTTGGVTASFASIGDIIIAEPKALIGFAGPRVIEQTIRQKLPEGFQRAEFLQDHGFVDIISHRHNLKETTARVIKMLMDPQA